MSNEKIEALKCKLNELIEKDAPYEEVYKLSKLIDEYIVEFYKEQNAV
ncbi:MAG: Spo0E family sporulation regulatory protein-aspartic acid phosphatase [Clostridia bacterium]|nr:Spo0E family sporulation regulatory protein-aspartic acid phosphatase [Clostridia bacterium]